MSHIVQVQDFSIVSLSALKCACERLGFDWNEGQSKQRFYGGTRGGCLHTIRVPKTSWEIGVAESKTHPGTYELRADFFGKNGQVLRGAVQQLRQMYVVELTREIARRRGYTVTEYQEADGSIRLQVAVAGGM